jgi:hypothetical protein
VAVERDGAAIDRDALQPQPVLDQRRDAVERTRRRAGEPARLRRRGLGPGARLVEMADGVEGGIRLGHDGEGGLRHLDRRQGAGAIGGAKPGRGQLAVFGGSERHP